MSSEVMTPTSRSGDALPAWMTVLAGGAHPDDESFGLGELLGDTESLRWLGSNLGATVTP